MKTLVLSAMFFFAFIAQLEAAPGFDGDGNASADAAYRLMRAVYVERDAPVFNALDAADSDHAEYQAGLCQAGFAAYRRFYSDRYWLDHLDPKMAGMSPERREVWAADYVVTTALRDGALNEFEANCR